METRPRVVIIGAGFGGLQCARKLSRAPVRVTLLDRHNYHLFTPLLYEVSSSLLNPSDVAPPVRSIVRSARNTEFRLVEVTGVDFENREVLTNSGLRFPYDYLVIAAGSTTNFFSIHAKSATNGSIGYGLETSVHKEDGHVAHTRAGIRLLFVAQVDREPFFCKF